MARSESLLDLGCFDRRLDRLADAIDPLLTDDQALSGLASDEPDQFRSLAPRLKEICRELAAFGLPATLVHGDLHPGNIAMRDGQPIIFDWTDACLAHPFFDVISFAEIVEELDDKTAWSRLRDGYLAEWIAFGSLERLRQAFALAEPLGALHQSVSYQRLVANTVGPTRQSMVGGVAYWVRRVLKTAPVAGSA